MSLTIDEILEVLENGVKPSNTFLLQQILTVYMKVFGKLPCVGCPGNLEAALLDLKQFLIQNPSIMKRQFELSGVLTIFGTGESYTNKNLTDKKAVELLAENPGRISFFSEYPENWEELVESHNEQIELLEKYNSLKTDAITALKNNDKVTAIDLYSQAQEMHFDEDIQSIIEQTQKEVDLEKAKQEAEEQTRKEEEERLVSEKAAQEAEQSGNNETKQENVNPLDGVTFEKEWLKENKSVKELRLIAGAQGKSKYSRLKEDELIELILS